MSSSTTPVGGSKKFWSSRRVISTLVVLSLVAAFGISSCNSSEVEKPGAGVASNRPAAPSQKSAPSRPAPATFATLPESVRSAQLTGLDGVSFKLADYSGKVLLVNLWASWCGPCRQEMPELVKLYREFKSQGVEIVGLTSENPEAAEEDVKDFVRATGVNYRIGWASNEIAATLMQGRNSIPQSYIISRDGRIVKRFIGYGPTMAPQLRQALEDAVNDKGNT